MLVTFSMRLYLVQHGEAKPESEDPDRPLTTQGADDVTRVARHALEDLGILVAKVVHSGKTRARQTAEIWRGLSHAEVAQAGGLAPNDDPAIWAARLDAEGNDLMLVGHLPHLALLSARILTGGERQGVRFQPGALLALEHDEGGWVAWALIPPPHPAP